MQPLVQADQTHPEQVGVSTAEACLSDVKINMSSHRPSWLLTSKEVGSIWGPFSSTWRTTGGCLSPRRNKFLFPDLYTLTSMEDPGSSCPYSQPLQPLQHTLQVFTDRRKLGCSLRRLQFRWDLVHSRKQCTHKFSGIKRRFASSKEVWAPSSWKNYWLPQTTPQLQPI